MRNILVLSTDEQLLQFLNVNLAYQNFAVGVLRDASNLANALYCVNPDLLMVDFFLNDINGGAICHQLKCDPVTRDLPVILLSDEPKVARFSNKFGCNAIISKSTQLSQLANIIDTLLHSEIRLKAC